MVPLPPPQLSGWQFLVYLAITMIPGIVAAVLGYLNGRKVDAGNLQNKAIVSGVNQVKQIAVDVKRQTDGLTDRLVESAKIVSREAGIKEGVAQEKGRATNDKSTDPDKP